MILTLPRSSAQHVASSSRPWSFLDARMEHARKYEVRLAHPVRVTEALKYLAGQLGCDSWYVACHHERLFVFRLAQGGTDRYAASFECTGPVDKGIYHDSKAWSLSISPLHQQPELTPEQVRALEAGLSSGGV